MSQNDIPVPSIETLLKYFLHYDVFNAEKKLAYLEKVFQTATGGNIHDRNDKMGAWIIPLLVAAFKYTAKYQKGGDEALIKYLSGTYYSIDEYTEGSGSNRQIYPILLETKKRILQEAASHWKYERTKLSVKAFDLLTGAYNDATQYTQSLVRTTKDD